MPDIVNNGNHGTVYLASRDNEEALKEFQNKDKGYKALKDEVEENYSTPGNYILLPGKKAEVNAKHYILASNEDGSGFLFDTRQVGNKAIQNIW